jgi:peptidoglycan/LPS O-acetylase OafA/YrhL
MLKNRINELDALRGIASLMVVIFHFTADRGDKTFSFNIGCVGVDLFFVISGFVISLTIENCISWKSFLLNRFSRLYPTYWVCLSITTLFILLSNFLHIQYNYDSNLLMTYLANLTMMPTYLNYSFIEGTYWTLVVELLFYFIVLWFIIFNKKQWLEFFGVILLILVFSYKFFIDEILSFKKMFEITDSIPLLIYFPLFYSGILFYKMKFNEQNFKRWLLIILSFVIQLYVYNRLYSNREYLSITEYAIALALIYSTFIIYLYNKLHFIINKITFWFGSISYALYLLHKVIGTSFFIPLLTIKLGLNYWLAMPLTLIIIIFISYLVMKYIEKPSLIFIRKKYLNKTQNLITA